MRTSLLHHFILSAVSVCMLLVSGNAVAQAKEQFIGLPSYRIGAYAAGGSGVFGGFIDYLTLINERDGGIGGIKLVIEECETEYNNARGVECYERLKKRGAIGNAAFMPVSTGITYSVLDKVASDKIPLVTIGYGRTDAADGRVFPWVFPLITTYWSQATTMIKYIGIKEGGVDPLKGKKIVYLYHDSAYGKEGFTILEKQAQKYGFTFVPIAVAHPGNEQQSQWLRIRQEKPDWVILWGWGVMNPTALKTAAKTGFPREKIIGVWWAGAEEDTVPAGDAAKGFTAAAFNVSGANYPVIQAIQSIVYKRNKGNMEDRSRIGSVYYNRGIVHGIIMAEAIRIAQTRFGKRPLSGDEMRWGFEHLRIDAARLKELGAENFMPDFKISCADHEGSGKVRYQQWDGTTWRSVSGWIESDREMVRPMIEESAARYAAEKHITPRDCSKED